MLDRRSIFKAIAGALTATALPSIPAAPTPALNPPKIVTPAFKLAYPHIGRRWPIHDPPHARMAIKWAARLRHDGFITQSEHDVVVANAQRVIDNAAQIHKARDRRDHTQEPVA